MTPIIGAGSPRDPQSIKLSTKLGNWIPNERRKELHPDVMRAKVNAHSAFVDKINAKLRSISGVYNCVGMVFAARRVHIDDEHVRRILKEDGYRQIKEGDAMDDDIVVYTSSKSVVHVGRIAGKQPNEKGELERRVLSKWGEDGEYFHPITDIPEVFQSDGREIWTERKECP